MFSSLLLLAHTIISVLLILIVLIQRSEGGIGALGGGGADALMSGAASGNAMTKATRWLFIFFIVTSLALAYNAKGMGARGSVVEQNLQSIEIPMTVPQQVPAQAE